MSIRQVNEMTLSTGVRIIEVEVEDEREGYTSTVFEVICDRCDTEGTDGKLAQITSKNEAVTVGATHFHCQHCDGVIVQRPTMSSDGDLVWCRTVPVKNVFPHWCPASASGGHRPREKTDG